MRDDSDVLGFVASDRGWSPDDVGGVVKQSPYIQLLSRGILELATNSHIPPEYNGGRSSWEPATVIS